MIKSTAELRKEVAIRAGQMGLSVDCPPDGTFNAQIAVIAEAPGEMEVLKKSPLVGASGTKLWQLLRKHGITRMDCYITNVSKQQLSFSDRKRSMGKKDQALWNDLLLWELSQLPNLKYVLLLGNFALNALLAKDGISNWRGSVLPSVIPRAGGSTTIQCVCTFNPAMILREPKTEISFQLDLAKLKRVIDGKHKTPIITAHINPTYQEAQDWINRIYAASRAGLPIACDIEVIGNETACIGFAFSSTEGVCINFRDSGNNRYTLVEERTIRKELQSLFADTTIRWIMQNASFDMSWMWFKDHLKVHACWFDTMLAHHCLYPSLPHNLGYITTQYTDYPFYKDEKKNWREGGNIDDFWRYNVHDCCNTYAAAIPILHELRQQNLEKFFFEHIMRLQPHLVRMTVGGVKIDTTLKDRIRQDLAEDVAKKLTAFHQAVHAATGIEDYFVNPNSPKQLSTLLFNQLKLVGHGTSTDEANRNKMRGHRATNDTAKAVLDTLDAYKEDHKFLSTYADMEIDPDGRARCEYSQIGVASAPGRLSSKKVLWGSGMNLQNQPPRAQPMFIADEGYSLCYFDMAQAEARLVAYFANIVTWKEQFERARIDGSYDAHRALAAQLFKVPYDEVPTGDRDDHGNYTIRYKAKRCRHGLNYRMQAERLSQTAGIPYHEAFMLYRTYHKETPELEKWWAALEREVRTSRMLFNAYGRRLFILERITDEALEAIVAFKPQSTLGDHVTRVMYQSEDDPEWPSDTRLWMNNHDSLIALAPHAKAKKALSIMKRYAEAPIQIGVEQLIIPADCKISYPVVWGKNAKGEDDWIEDASGIHRWACLKKLKDI